MSADSDLSKEYIKLLASTQVRSNGIFLFLTARITSKAIERGEQFVRNSDSGGTSSGNGFSANGTSSRGAPMTLGERGLFFGLGITIFFGFGTGCFLGALGFF